VFLSIMVVLTSRKQEENKINVNGVLQSVGQKCRTFGEWFATE